jgi:PAS domain S-box-containing protein
VFCIAKDQEWQLPQKLIARATESGSAKNEGWRVRKDGSIFWGSIVITAIHNDQNKVIGFTKVTKELTDKLEHSPVSTS